MMEKKRHYFKLNEDDILNIVNDYINSTMEDSTCQTRLQFLSDEGHTIIAVTGELDDIALANLDLKEYAKTVEYNGEYSKLTSDYFIDLEKPNDAKQLIDLLARLENEDN